MHRDAEGQSNPYAVSYKKSQTATVILMPTFKTCSVLKPTSWSLSYMLVFK